MEQTSAALLCLGTNQSGMPSAIASSWLWGSLSAEAAVTPSFQQLQQCFITKEKCYDGGYDRLSSPKRASLILMTCFCCKQGRAVYVTCVTPEAIRKWIQLVESLPHGHVVLVGMNRVWFELRPCGPWPAWSTLLSSFLPCQSENKTCSRLQLKFDGEMACWCLSEYFLFVCVSKLQTSDGCSIFCVP